MIRKLRIKLVTASMLSLIIVMSIILGVAGVLNYKKVINDADSVLSILKQNDGNFPIPQRNMKSYIKSSKIHKDNHRLSPELPYESRYFSVFLTNEGNTVSVNTGKIAAVDETTAVDYAKIVINSNKLNGFVNDYRYIVYYVDTQSHIIFLDCGRELNSFRTFIFISILVFIVGLLAVMLLLIFFSGKIVKPFSESYEKQKQFITDAGHELKTPLTIIDEDTEILEMDYGENEWLNDIKKQTKRLTDLTNSLIFLAKMEENQPKTEKIDFSLSDSVEETAETFKALAKTNNKTLINNIEPLISLNGDEKAIRQLISILLDNAIKYSDNNGKIEIALSKQKNCIKLSVFNTCDYVSKENLTNLFDRFYRTDKSRNSQTGGYGLGLSIALAIVNAHKGKITASTQDEKSLLITALFNI